MRLLICLWSVTTIVSASFPPLNSLTGLWDKTRSDITSMRKNCQLNSIKSCKSSMEKVCKASFDCIEQSTLSSHVHLPFEGRGGSTTTKKKRRRQNNSGFYYGIRDDIFFPQKDDEDLDNIKEKNESPKSNARTNTSQGTKVKQNMKRDELSSRALADIMGETLLELREMREDIMALREEMQYMKEEMKRQEHMRLDMREESRTIDEEDIDYPSHEDHPLNLVERMRRQKEFEDIGRDVEKWAHKMLFEEHGEEYGWKEVKCNKMVKHKFNPMGTTTCYMKWMKDSRGKHSNPNNDQEFPCIKVFASINAPLEDVCDYLSQEEHMTDYNDLVIAHKDLENITPHSKICWSQCPPILFIKPRDFVTFCHHRWRRDGTQIIVSQACDHPDSPGNTEESDNHACRAFSLRGANCKLFHNLESIRLQSHFFLLSFSFNKVIGRDPSDPEHKTRIAILAHADPGGNIPQWAQKSAVRYVSKNIQFFTVHTLSNFIFISTFNFSARLPQSNHLSCSIALMSKFKYIDLRGYLKEQTLFIHCTVIPLDRRAFLSLDMHVFGHREAQKLTPNPFLSVTM